MDQQTQCEAFLHLFSLKQSIKGATAIKKLYKQQDCPLFFGNTIQKIINNIVKQIGIKQTSQQIYIPEGILVKIMESTFSQRKDIQNSEDQDQKKIKCKHEENQFLIKNETMKDCTSQSNQLNSQKNQQSQTLVLEKLDTSIQTENKEIFLDNFEKKMQEEKQILEMQYKLQTQKQILQYQDFINQKFTLYNKRIKHFNELLKKQLEAPLELSFLNQSQEESIQSETKNSKTKLEDIAQINNQQENITCEVSQSLVRLSSFQDNQNKFDEYIQQKQNLCLSEQQIIPNITDQESNLTQDQNQNKSQYLIKENKEDGIDVKIKHDQEVAKNETINFKIFDQINMPHDQQPIAKETKDNLSNQEKQQEKAQSFHQEEKKLQDQNMQKDSTQKIKNSKSINSYLQENLIIDKEKPKAK